MKGTNSLRKKIQSNTTLSLIILIASLVLPIIALSNMAIPGVVDSYFVFTNWLWMGFYSTIFSILFLKKNGWIILLIIVNIGIILFALVSSLLNGLPGMLYMIIKIIIPFIPDKWIGINLQP